MTIHQLLMQLKDRVSLLDLEPGPASRNKQAVEILQKLQTIKGHDVADAEDAALYTELREKVTAIIQE